MKNIYWVNRILLFTLLAEFPDTIQLLEVGSLFVKGVVDKNDAEKILFKHAGSLVPVYA
jgi:hypothetical protein